MPRLVRRHENGNVEIFAFTGTAVVGRSRRAQIVIDDVSISATHARIEEAPDGHWVSDLDSRNGTKVNATEVKQRERLKPGDEVRFGKIVLTFEKDDAPIVAPADPPPASASVSPLRERMAQEPPLKPTEPPRVPASEPGRASGKDPAGAEAPARPPEPIVPPPPRPAPAVAAAPPPAKAGNAELQLRVLREQVRQLEKQRSLLAGIVCVLGLLAVIFLVGFLMKRTRVLELEHGVNVPRPEEAAEPR